MHSQLVISHAERTVISAMQGSAVVKARQGVWRTQIGRNATSALPRCNVHVVFLLAILRLRVISFGDNLRTSGSASLSGGNFRLIVVER